MDTRRRVVRSLGPPAVTLLFGLALAACSSETATAPSSTTRTSTVAAAASDLPGLEILTPANNEQVIAFGGSTDLDVEIQLSGGPIGQDAYHIRYYLDGVEQGEVFHIDPFSMTGVTMGYRQVAARIVDVDGNSLPNEDSLAVAKVKVVGPCNDASDCDDGLSCSNASCTGGQCKYGQKGGCCDHDLQCPYGWTCLDGECAECTADAACDDGDLCTVDVCGANGMCEHVQALGCCHADKDCDDGSVCTQDSCDLGTNACVHEAVGGEECCTSDADCFTDDPCVTTFCQQLPGEVFPVCRYGPSLAGCCLTTDDCDDGNPCTVASCDLVEGAGGAGQCAFEPDPAKPSCCVANADCDDGDPLTIDGCVDNACISEDDPNACTLPATSPVVFNELMLSPGAVADTFGEWLELYNATDDFLDLDGYKLALSNGKSHKINWKSKVGVPVPPGGYVVLARNGGSGANGGVKPTYTYGSSIQLFDKFSGVDALPLTLQLLDPEGEVVDEVTWDEQWPVEMGRSLELIHPHLDNALPESWAVSGHSTDVAKNKKYGPYGVFGSPGFTNASSYLGVDDPSCVPEELGVPCIVGRCELGSQCSYSLGESCCVVDGDCDDFDQCTYDACDVGTHTCKPSVDIAECCNVDADCSDGDACTLDRCLGGECRYGPTGNSACCSTDSQCDDDDPCTVDVCNLNSKTCYWSAVELEPGQVCCDDSAQCDDGDPTTLDLCDGTSGACMHPDDPEYCDSLGDACDDGDHCTVDYCDVEGATCVHAPKLGCCGSDADCDDGNGCTIDVCDVATGKCVISKDEACCEADVDCDDGDPCTFDVCAVSGACHHEDLGEGCCAVDADCNDGAFCTTEACVDNACVPAQLSGCCDPSWDQDELISKCGSPPPGGWACSEDSQCVAALAVTSCSADEDCDDGIECTADVCSPGGACKHFTWDFGCDDGNDCTEDTCDALTGCSHEPIEAACDNGNGCTANDTCIAGECIGFAGGALQDYVPIETTCGVGACASTGVTACFDELEVDLCDPGDPAHDDASCDQIDSDCDGVVDEDCVATFGVADGTPVNTEVAGHPSGGSWSVAACPPGQVATAWEAYSARGIARVRLDCRDLASGSGDHTKWLGSGFGEEATPATCPDDQVMVGAEVFHGSTVNGVKGLCASPDEAWSGEADDAAPTGGGVGTETGKVSVVRCPDGHVVVGLWGAAALQVEAMGLTCAPIERLDGPPVDEPELQAPEPGCAIDGNCGSDEACVMGQCVPSAGLCKEDADCGEYMQCDEFDTVWGTCTPDAETNPDCEAGCSSLASCGTDALACTAWCSYTAAITAAGPELAAWATCAAGAGDECSEDCMELGEEWLNAVSETIYPDDPIGGSSVDTDDGGGFDWGSWNAPPDDGSGGCSAGQGPPPASGSLVLLVLLAAAVIARRREDDDAEEQPARIRSASSDRPADPPRS